MDEKATSASPAGAAETFSARQYAHDLYRFFNLFSRRHEFRNPFDGNLNLLTDNPVSPLLQTVESEQAIAAWLLGKNYYQEAVQAFRLMESTAHPYSTDYRFYQQMGYALQRTQSYKEALEAYHRSDILQSDNNWTLRHSAQCLRILGQPEQALDMLLQAEKRSSDNLSLQIQIGDCLVDLKRYDDALTRFFKVDYLKPDYPKAWRAIGWCAFLAGRTDKSIEYYDKLLKLKPNANDCLNAGHAYFVEGNIQRAVSLYRQSRSMMGPEEFEAEFNKDRPILASKGIAEQDFPLLWDLIE
jgi:tetratricopeptide (TPR) repeat protein